MESIELTPTDRQLLLYDIFKGSRQVELADITSRLPIGRKMIQRDMKTLRQEIFTFVKIKSDCQIDERALHRPKL